MAGDEKTLLRFITCGSVDDGKSTLIGRLLYDAHLLCDDQIEVLSAESNLGSDQNDELDFSLLVDGLTAEREQGITIDVAYRYFATSKRKFIVADTPGHEQYTRNMATGASTADVAILLVDVRKGILPQTRRHAFIAKTLGIKHLVLAVNKMDLVGFDQADFDRVVEAFESVVTAMGFVTSSAFPISAKQGDNVVKPSANMAWCKGPSLLDHLECMAVGDELSAEQPFRFPVQRAVRLAEQMRGAAGSVAAGRISVGDRVTILPSGAETKVAQIITFDGDLETATMGQAITLVFHDQVDCPRGACVVRSDARAATGQHFDVSLIWMNQQPSREHQRYALLLGPQRLMATLTMPGTKYCLDTLAQVPATAFHLNDIGAVRLTTQAPLIADRFEDCAEMGRFILVDTTSHETVAAGTIQSHARISQDVHWQYSDIGADARATQKGQKPIVVWFTGLSGSGKSTIASRVEKRLFELGKHSFILDGDNVRHGLCSDLGFDETGRRENIRRVGEVAKLMAEAGLIVLAAFISPFAADRDMVRSILPSDQFLEVFVDVTLDTAEKRDAKGLYARARAGQIKNFTGIDAPFETPSNPDLVLNTDILSIDESVSLVMQAIAMRLE